MAQNAGGLDDLWRCPQCRGVLRRMDDALLCSESTCRLSYPVVDGIPVMLIEQASALSEAVWSETLGRANASKSQSRSSYQEAE